MTTAARVSEIRKDGELISLDVVFPDGAMSTPDLSMTLHLPAECLPFAEWLVEAWNAHNAEAL